MKFKLIRFFLEKTDKQTYMDRLKKEKIALFDTKLPTTSKTEIKPSKYSLTSTGQKELSNIIKSSANIIHSHQTKKPIQSEWDHILDPEERKNAILAKSKLFFSFYCWVRLSDVTSVI